MSPIPHKEQNVFGMGGLLKQFRLLPSASSEEIEVATEPREQVAPEVNGGAAHTLNGDGRTSKTAPKVVDPISYDRVKVSADYILARTSYRPKIAIICGSGLGGLGDTVTNADIFPYTEIPNFPVSTVAGHAGRLLIGRLGGEVEVLVMQGRFHSYEGYQLWQTALPVRVMKLVGIETLFVTNAAGGINKGFQVGDVMFINDHINMPGFCCESPLRGPNDDRFGARFFPANHVYTEELIEKAEKLAKEMCMSDYLRQGVYAMTGGPNYETNAEVRLLSMLGVDAVGMSTIPETLVAHHCGIKVFACSLITNLCGVETNHEEVMVAAVKRAEKIREFITQLAIRVSKADYEALPSQ